MNALHALLADIQAAHAGRKLAPRATACPQGQATRPASKARPTPVAKPARQAPPAKVATPAADLDALPIIARALATLRAELGKVTS